MCGIVGIFRHEGQVSAELYEGLLMLQHRGQDSAGMVTFDDFHAIWNYLFEDGSIVYDVSDVNGDGTVSIADAISIASYVNYGGRPPVTDILRLTVPEPPDEDDEAADS